MSRLKLTFLLVPAILVGSVAIAIGLFALRPRIPPSDPPKMIPPVEYIVAEAVDHRLVVHSEGTVEAARQIMLIPEVSGRIDWVDPRFEIGGFFESGDPMLRIDTVSYEASLAEAEARLAGARAQLAEETAQGEQARQDWSRIGDGEPSDLVLRKPQQDRVRAEIMAAEAAVILARQNLERTTLRAPFTGRLRTKEVDLGQMVAAGASMLGAYYGIETARVRFPLTAQEVSLLEPVGLDRNAGDSPVHLMAADGLSSFQWKGMLVGLEGTIAARTRLLNAVVDVPDPYGRQSPESAQRPLKVGQFVEAEIEGRLLEDVFVLPRQAFVDNELLYVIGEGNRLTRRRVEVIQSTPETVVVTGGLESGERLNLTPIDFYIEGMAVEPVVPEDVP